MFLCVLPLFLAFSLFFFGGGGAIVTWCEDKYWDNYDRCFWTDGQSHVATKAVGPQGSRSKIEASCAACASHLGHIFPGGRRTTTYGPHPAPRARRPQAAGRSPGLLGVTVLLDFCKANRCHCRQPPPLSPPLSRRTAGMASGARGSAHRATSLHASPDITFHTSPPPPQHTSSHLKSYFVATLHALCVGVCSGLAAGRTGERH